MFEQKDYYLKRIKCWGWFQISIGDIHSCDQWSLSLSPTPTVCTNSNMSFKYLQAIRLGEKVYKPRFMSHHIVFCSVHTSFFLSPCLSSSLSFSFSLAMSYSHFCFFFCFVLFCCCCFLSVSSVFFYACFHVSHTECVLSCFSWLCDPMDCSLQGSSVDRILQARILEWVAMPSFRGSSWPMDRTCVPYVSCIGRRVLYHQHHSGSPTQSKGMNYFSL